MVDYTILSSKIKDKASDFGFLEAKIASIKIDDSTKANFLEWLASHFHGDMDYLNKNVDLRFNPELLHNNTLSIICVKMPYLTKEIRFHENRLLNTEHAYISSYALGRDYHKVLKKQLKAYAQWIQSFISNLNHNFNYRVFTDSAPILEVELAQNAGLGWRGKNTLLLHKHQGSMFFLGEIFTNLPLIIDSKTTAHCGSCDKCLSACPTNAFVKPYVLDATKCISYLTIEHKGTIPIQYRKLIGNRIYGCDDCQLVCPWNKFSKLTNLPDFAIRHEFDSLSLANALLWTEEEWQVKMQGSAIYRIGYEKWLRNVAIGLGNAPTTNTIISVLKKRLNNCSEMVKEHILWALKQHQSSMI
ncbi:MAG: tRNA epoxyqueuosine(34) reductase QueG [Neisseriaceae bacterium]